MVGTYTPAQVATVVLIGVTTSLWCGFISYSHSRNPLTALGIVIGGITVTAITLAIIACGESRNRRPILPIYNNHAQNNSGQNRQQEIEVSASNREVNPHSISAR